MARTLLHIYLNLQECYCRTDLMRQRMSLCRCKRTNVIGMSVIECYNLYLNLRFKHLNVDIFVNFSIFEFLNQYQVIALKNLTSSLCIFTVHFYIIQRDLDIEYHLLSMYLYIILFTFKV